MILDYKNIPVYYSDQGEGQVVVLLHGFLETSTMWKDITAELVPSHRVIALDLLGHGQTGCLGYLHTMEMMAEMVHFVLNHLNIQGGTFIGHSMGGYVALALAEAYPQMLERMCLMNSTPFADTPERQENRDRAIKAVKYERSNFVGTSISNLFRPENRLLYKNDIEQIKYEASSISVQGIIAALEGMKIRTDRSEIYKKLSVPKLTILGEHDPVIEYANNKPILESLGSEIATVSGGHMSYIENMSEIIYIIRQFVEK